MKYPIYKLYMLLIFVMYAAMISVLIASSEHNTTLEMKLAAAGTIVCAWVLYLGIPLYVFRPFQMIELDEAGIHVIPLSKKEYILPWSEVKTVGISPNSHNNSIGVFVSVLPPDKLSGFLYRRLNSLKFDFAKLLKIDCNMNMKISRSQTFSPETDAPILFLTRSFPQIEADEIIDYVQAHAPHVSVRRTWYVR